MGHWQGLLVVVIGIAVLVLPVLFPYLRWRVLGVKGAVTGLAATAGANGMALLLSASVGGIYALLCGAILGSLAFSQIRWGETAVKGTVFYWTAALILFAGFVYVASLYAIGSALDPWAV